MVSSSISPKVSVVMSVYNGERYLREAVDSILSQTFSDYEFIIIDDASTDGTPTILSSYDDPRIRLFRNHNNLGLARSLNRGLRAAQGEYVARMDADDISLPERLEQQVDFLDSHPLVGLISSWFEVINEASNPLNIAKLPTTNEVLQHRLLKGNVFCHGAAMFRMDCLRKVGPYRPEFIATQDFDLWLRIAEHYEVANLSESLYLWRENPTSVTNTNSEIQDAYASFAILLAQERRAVGKDLLGSHLEGCKHLDPNTIHTRENSRSWTSASHIYYVLARHYHHRRNLPLARSNLFESILNNPFNTLPYAFILSWLRRRVSRMFAT